MPTTSQPDFSSAQRAVAETMREHWGLFLAEGVILVLPKGTPGLWWSLVSAIIGIVAGVILLAWPMSRTVSLTLVLIAFFIMEGVASIMYGIEHPRKRRAGRAGSLRAGSSI